MTNNLDSNSSRRRGVTAAGLGGLALASVLLLCGAGNAPIENFAPQGAMQADLNAGGHSVTNAANVNATAMAATSLTATTATIGTLTAPSFTLPFSRVSATPTTLAGYGIANATVAGGKTLTANNTLTLAGTDGSTLNVGNGGTLGSAAFQPATAFDATGAAAAAQTAAVATAAANAASLYETPGAAAAAFAPITGSANYLAPNGAGAGLTGINGAAPAQTISATTTYTLNAQGRNTSLVLTLGTGTAAYTASIVLSDTGCRTGDLAYLNVAWPTSTNPTLNVYDNSTGGTLIAGPLLGTAAGGASTLQFEFNGTAWVHFSKGEVAARNLGANVQAALGAPLNASTGVQGYTQPFDAAEHYDNFNHGLSASSSADTTFTGDDGGTWTASSDTLGYPSSSYDPPTITNPTINGVTVPSLGGTTGTGIYYVHAPALSNPVKNFGASFYYGASTGAATNYTGGCVLVGDINLADCVHISFARAYCQIQMPTVHGGIPTLRTLYTMYFSHNTGGDVLKTDGTIYNISVVLHGNQLTVSMAGQSHTLSDPEVGVVAAMASPIMQFEEYNGTPGTANSDKLYWSHVYVNGPSPYVPGRDVQGWSETLDALSQEGAVPGKLTVNMGRAILPGGGVAGVVIPEGGTFYNYGTGVDNGWHFTQVYGTAGYCAGPFVYNQFTFSGTATSSNNAATDFGSLVLIPTEYVVTVLSASGVTTGPTLTVAGTSYNMSGLTSAGQCYYIPLSGQVGGAITGGYGVNVSVTTAATGTSPTESLRLDVIGYVQ